MKETFGFSDRDNDGERASRGCERAEDLVTYLYGEAAPAEARSFNTHLNTCAVCRDELAAFGGVRSQVGVLCEEAVSAAPRLDTAKAFAPASNVAERAARKHSAVAALREFLSLSPLWLRAGTAFAALVVCALAALTFARAEVRWDEKGVAFRLGAPMQTVEKRVEAPAPGMFTEQQVKEIAERRAAEALEAYRASEANQREDGAVDASATPKGVAAVAVSDERQPRRGSLADQRKPKRNYRQNLEFEPDEEELPGLYDLLREAN